MLGLSMRLAGPGTFSLKLEICGQTAAEIFRAFETKPVAGLHASCQFCYRIRARFIGNAGINHAIHGHTGLSRRDTCESAQNCQRE